MSVPSEADASRDAWASTTSRLLTIDARLRSIGGGGAATTSSKWESAHPQGVLARYEDATAVESRHARLTRLSHSPWRKCDVRDTLFNRQSVEDCIIDQASKRYSAEDHAIWRVLFERQLETLKGRICREYLDGLEALGIGPDGIPDFERMKTPRSGA